MIDADPQSNATSAAGIPKNSESSLYEYFEEGGPLVDYIKDATGAIKFFQPTQILSPRKIIENTKREKFFSSNLKINKKGFDYIIFDCPPSLNLLTINAMEYCKNVLVPAV